MNESNMRENPPKESRRIAPYVAVAVCVAAVLLAVFLWKPAPPGTVEQASAAADSQTIQQQIDPLQLTNPSILGENISVMTNGLTQGTDFDLQTINAGTNAYNIAMNIGFLSIADEQDSLILYTDSATETINTVEYYGAVPKEQISALLAALEVKMKALESAYGSAYQTAYFKDASVQSADNSYTYQKIYDALSSGQAGIYSINWPLTGVVVTLKIYNLPDQNHDALQISYWAYAGEAASATP